MKVTLKNGPLSLDVEVATYTIAPKYINIWVNDFAQVNEILRHRICESIRISFMNCNYNSWQLGFKTEDIKIEI